MEICRSGLFRLSALEGGDEADNQQAGNSRWSIFEVLPSRSLPPLGCWRGVRPTQAAKSRPLAKVSQGGAKVVSAVARRGASAHRLSWTDRRRRQSQAWIPPARPGGQSHRENRRHRQLVSVHPRVLSRLPYGASARPTAVGRGPIGFVCVGRGLGRRVAGRYPRLGFRLPRPGGQRQREDRGHCES